MSTSRLYDIQPKEATYAHKQTISSEASALSYYANFDSFLLILETHKKISAIYCFCEGDDARSYVSRLIEPEIFNAAQIAEDVQSKKHLVSIGVDNEEVRQLKESYKTLEERVDFSCLARETLLTELLANLPGVKDFILNAEIKRQKSGCTIL